MISVVVYGRNDTHGYNHHRRVALSLNCLAEVLTDPADEIIFVDYNTPDELPTAVEALADTLTGRCLGLLRVLRVPASLHAERYGGRTHLGLAEPVARNAAARRANPSNRWLLSTNTDMILIPLQGDSLSEVCGDLPDGFYGLPRFELPEWVWERLPRADPRRALAEVEHLGPALHLDEPTLSDEWVRFDAPGDFQLVLRDDFLSIDGFDEEMLLGWHLDSNLSRRMRLHRGSIETLEGIVAGYHCNHSRIPTVYHGAERISNDLDRFYHSVESAALPAQRATWGLADSALEEVPLQRQIGPAFVDALLATLPIETGPRPSSDAVKAGFGTSYDSGHVLPFIADSLVVSPLTTIGYLGINPILRQMLARLVEELGHERNMRVAELADPNDVEEVAHSADLFVVDLGTDLSLIEASNVARLGDESAPILAGLDLVFAALERLVEVERARLGRGAHPRRIVLVNSSTVFLDAYALAAFDCSSTTVHCRVRRATVKALADDEASKTAFLSARALARWALGRRNDSGGVRLAPGKTVRFADLEGNLSLSAGWAFPDEAGVWTWGSRSELSIAFPQVDGEDCTLVFLIDTVCVAPDEALRVELLVDGVRVARRDASQFDAPFAWRVELPPRVVSAGSANLTITIDEPRSPLAVGWSTDARPLGLHLRCLTLGKVDHSVQPRQPVVFSEGTDGERLLAEGWSLPDATGVWTVGDRARLVLELSAEPLSEAVLVLDVVPFLTPEHAELTLDAWALDTHVARRVFRHDDLEGRLVLRLPPSVRDERGRTVVDLHLDQPARPVDLGMSSDERRLGLHLRSLTLGELDHSVQPRQPVVFGAGMDGERLLGGGWSVPDATGVWTDGDRARLVLELSAEPLSEAVLVLDVVPFLTPEHAELTLDAWALDTHVARRVFRHDDLEGRLVLRLPPSVRDETGRTVVDLHLDQPARPVDLGMSSDERRLGLHLRSLTLGELDHSVQPRQPVVFGAGMDGERLLGGGWSVPDATGVWTDGDRARLVLELSAEPLSEAVLVLDVVPFLTPEHAELTLDAWALDTHVARRVFRHDDLEGRLVLRLPPSVRDETGRTVVDLHLDQPARPVDLGLSSDPRRLGLHLDALTLDGRLTVHAGETTEFADLTDQSGFGDGWAFCNDEGVWTLGNRSNLALALEGISGAEYCLVLSVGGAHPAFEGTRTLELLVNGARASIRPLTSNDCVFTWRVDLPADLGAVGEASLTLVTSEGQTTVALGPGADIRERGIRVDAIGLEAVDRSLEVGQSVSFIEGSGAERFLGDGWSGLEASGVWTIGQRARISFQLPADAGTDLELVLGSYAYVPPGRPGVEAVFTARKERLGARLRRHGVRNRVVSIPLTGAVVDTQGRVLVDIEIDHPVSPKELGTGSDTRLLGLHLKWLMVRRPGVRGHWDAVQNRLRRAIPRRRAGEATRTTDKSRSALPSGR